MSGKPNDKWMETMIKKHGSREALREWQQSIGAKGGHNGTTGGFAAHNTCNGKCRLDYMFGLNHKRSQCSGYKGGRTSKRKKATQNV